MAPDRIRNDPIRSNHPLTVILDTSFILAMLEQRRDIDEELRDLIRGPVLVATLDLVKLELERIGRMRSSGTAGLANAALKLLVARKYSTFTSGIETSRADAAILSFALAQREPLAIATVDRKLRETLSRLGVRVISPRRYRGLMLSMVPSSST